ncbi:MAG: hypothetical protein IPN81_00955 [Nitrosomonadales bacterium]|nr:hypothetical protein [Nitrosomonadales bacterium]
MRHGVENRFVAYPLYGLDWMHALSVPAICSGDHFFLRCSFSSNRLPSTGWLIELAGENECRLFTSRVLIDELQRMKLAKQVQATGFTAAQMLRNY